MARSGGGGGGISVVGIRQRLIVSPAEKHSFHRV